MRDTGQALGLKRTVSFIVTFGLLIPQHPTTPMLKQMILGLALAGPVLLSAQTSTTRIALHQWASGFDEPVCIEHAGDGRLFVLNRKGMIKIVTDSMQTLGTPFLNITPQVNSGFGEQGLLGLAFDPGYADNGYFYVYYTAGSGAGSSRLSRFQVGADPNVADPNSEVILLTVQQPYQNHKGGCLKFGPDGYLYLGFGDGGSGNDPQANGQNMGTMLGKMIRIDVSGHGDTYAIPADNPFAGAQDTLPEIWASGLRNPWRWSFDRLTGDLWIGDVGQNAWEEVDLWPGNANTGPNFGWRCREGFVPTPGVGQSGCNAAGPFVEPVAAFSHSPQNWCSVIGGFVYRGPSFPHLYGKYIFTDYCAGDFITFGDGFTLDTLLMTNNSGSYSAFGEDQAGELYVTDMSNGKIWKIVDGCPMDPEITFDGITLTCTPANGYQWYCNGQPVPGATGMTHEPQTNGTYTVLASFAGNCQMASNAIDVTVTHIGDGNGFKPAVFPQPARSSVTLSAEGVAKPDLVVEVVDGLGHLVHTRTWPAGDTTLVIDVAGLAEGSYLLRGKAKGILQWVRKVQVVH